MRVNPGSVGGLQHHKVSPAVDHGMVVFSPTDIQNTGQQSHCGAVRCGVVCAVVACTACWCDEEVYQFLFVRVELSLLFFHADSLRSLLFGWLPALFCL